jgi:tetratricopeptide (TPR) repeat protein
LFRLAALGLIPLLLLGAIEWGLHLAGFGYPTHFFLKHTIQGHPVWIENNKIGWRFFPPEAARTPRRTVLASPKPSDTIRIFVLGESAAMGDPDADYSFGRMLEVLLEDQFPGTPFEVVNAAMTGINSHAILPIARDCARLDGDIWVVYMGNNEVIGPYGAGTVFGPQTPPLWLIRANLCLKSTRLGQALEAIRQRLRKDASPAKSWGGMEMFVDQQVRQDDPRMARVYHHFEQNLRDLLATGRRAGVKLIVSTVASNRKDCAPFGSLHRRELTEAQRKLWETSYQAGVACEQSGQPQAAWEQYSAAAKLDDQYADLAFRMGQSQWALSQASEARRLLAAARDYDTLRFRTDSRQNEIIIRQATNRTAEGIFLLDADALLARHSPSGVPGQESFYEHVHLNFAGNYQLAVAIARQCAALLPDSVQRGRSSSASNWLSEEACADRLAWTLWNQQELMEILRRRIELPPFTLQLNHVQQYQRILDEFNRLERLLDLVQLEQAVQVYRRAIARAPQDWAFHFNLGRLLRRCDHAAEAVVELKRAAELVPQHEEVYYHLGNVWAQLGQSAAAVTNFQKAIQLMPRFREAYNGLGLALADQGRYEEAIRQYETALRLKPDFAGAHVNLGLALSRLGRIEEAKQHYQTALKINPNSPGAYVNLGKLLNSQGQLSSAISNYLDALTLDPSNALIHFNLGNALLKRGQAPEAMSHYAEAVRLKPDFGEARCSLGFELARQGKNAEAMAQFAEAVRLDTNNAEAHLNLGVAYAQQQRIDESIHHFREALRVDPNYATARRYLDAALKRQRKN